MIHDHKGAIANDAVRTLEQRPGVAHERPAPHAQGLERQGRQRNRARVFVRPQLGVEEQLGERPEAGDVIARHRARDGDETLKASWRRRTAHMSLLTVVRRLFPARASSVAADHLGLGDALDKLTVLDIRIEHAADDGARDELSAQRERLAGRLPEVDRPIVQQLRLVNEELYFSDVEMDGAIMAEASDATIANITKRIHSLKQLKDSLKSKLDDESK